MKTIIPAIMAVSIFTCTGCITAGIGLGTALAEQMAAKTVSNAVTDQNCFTATLNSMGNADANGQAKIIALTAKLKQITPEEAQTLIMAGPVVLGNHFNASDVGYLRGSIETLGGEIEITQNSVGTRFKNAASQSVSNMDVTNMATDAVLGSELGSVAQGTVSQVNQVRSQVQGTLDSVNNVRTKVDNIGAQVNNVSNQVNNIGTQVNSVGTQVNSVGTQVNSVGTQVQNIGTKVGQVHSLSNESLTQVATQATSQTDNLNQVQAISNGLQNPGQTLNNAVSNTVDNAVGGVNSTVNNTVNNTVNGAVSQAEGTVQKLNPIPQGTVIPLNTEATPKVAPQVQPVQPLKTQTVNGASLNGTNEVKDDNLSDILLAE